MTQDEPFRELLRRRIGDLLRGIDGVIGLAAPRKIHRILHRRLIARQLRLLLGNLVVVARLLVTLCDVFGLRLGLRGLVVLLVVFLGGLLFLLDRGATFGPRWRGRRFFLLLNLLGTRGERIVRSARDRRKDEQARQRP